MLTPPDNHKCPRCSAYVSKSVSAIDAATIFQLLNRIDGVLNALVEGGGAPIQAVRAIKPDRPNPDHHHEPYSDHRFAELLELEEEMAGMDAGLRAKTIQRRMGLHPKTYYRLRQRAFKEARESHHSHAK